MGGTVGDWLVCSPLSTAVLSTVEELREMGVLFLMEAELIRG